MNNFLPILSITGSDSTGGSGIQGDIKTISALGGHAVTVLTSVTLQNMHGIQSVHFLPSEVVAGQLHSVTSDVTPKAVKIGMIGSMDSLRAIVDKLKYTSRIVIDPGIESSRSERLMDKPLMTAICHRLFPMCEIVVLHQREAEIILNVSIHSTDELTHAARQLVRYGMRAVVIYGGHCNTGLLTTVLVYGNETRFYTLPESGIWRIHGLGGILSSATATYLGQSGDIETAVSKAHEYVQSLALYSIELHDGQRTQMLMGKNNKYVTDRQTDLYQRFMQLVAHHCRKQHDVAFYSSQLCVSSRYLSQVVSHVTGKSPKQLIAGYIIREAERQVRCTKKPLQEICYEFGFSSQSQFSKFFKKHKGVSPSQIR